MKKSHCQLLTVFVFVTFIVVSLLSSCEGPAGADANENCIQCHNNQSLVLAKQIQAANSIHLTGGNFERNGSDCAPCHTHEGFIERIVSGEDTSMIISNPTPINCRTCHMIHENYDTTDFALQSEDPVTFWMNGETADMGSANLCLNCHQAIVPNPNPIGASGNLTIGSPYWGIHHGPQGMIIVGTGGYEVAGSKTYSNSVHSNIEKSCIACHMAEPYGAQAGGHTFNMTYQYHGHGVINQAGCVECHADADELETEIEELHEEIEGLTEELAGLLIADGIIDSSGTLQTPLVLTAEDAGILLNFKMVEEDRSSGIHNPKYIKAILQNSIEAAK